MNKTVKDFIKDIESAYPNSGEVVLTNCVDYKIESGQQFLTQFLLGITRQDPITVDFSYYKMNMNERLKNISGKPEYIGHHFRGEDVAAMRAVLTELAEYLKIDTDIEKMIGRLNRLEDSLWYYIVVTAIRYEVAYVQ